MPELGRIEEHFRRPTPLTQGDVGLIATQQPMVVNSRASRPCGCKVYVGCSTERDGAAAVGLACTPAHVSSMRVVLDALRDATPTADRPVIDLLSDIMAHEYE